MPGTSASSARPSFAHAAAAHLMAGSAWRYRLSRHCSAACIAAARRVRAIRASALKAARRSPTPAVSGCAGAAVESCSVVVLSRGVRWCRVRSRVFHSKGQSRRPSCLIVFAIAIGGTPWAARSSLFLYHPLHLQFHCLYNIAKPLSLYIVLNGIRHWHLYILHTYSSKTLAAAAAPSDAMPPPTFSS